MFKIKNKDKKGFTLIEIIVCISLITIIGVSTTFIIIKSNAKKEQKLLNRYASTFDNALEVYLSNHQEITDNIDNYANAAAITLEVLKNDGLIEDDLGINYKENYYLLSNAQLLSKDETLDVECDNDDVNVVSIEIFKNWDLKEVDGSKVIYVCPKNTGSDNSNSNNDTKELEDRISKLETIIQRMNFNDNNFVIFDVETDNSKIAYFPENASNNETEDYNDIWRIVTNSSNSSNYTLMYNQNISTNYKSLFPKVSDIEEYDSDLLIDTSTQKHKYNYATSYANCKNESYINDKVYSLSAAVLGQWYGFDGDLGKIQGLYKTGNDYYKSISYSNTNNCYYLTNKLDDVDAYIEQDLGYSYLKKDSSFIPYYFSKNSNYILDLVTVKNNLDYISMFDLRDTNPFKDALYNSINSNLKSSLIKTKKSYRYSLISSTNSLISQSDNSFNSTYLRTLTKDEVEKNKSWLSTFSIPIGLYVESWYDISDISYINDVVGAAKYSPIGLYYVYSSYGEITYNSSYVVNSYKSDTIGGNSSNIYISSHNPSYYVRTAKYYPVIDIKDATLITNINNYSTNYKNKRPTCTNDKLGTQECPYLLKLGNYYSDGTQ